LNEKVFLYRVIQTASHFYKLGAPKHKLFLNDELLYNRRTIILVIVKF